MFLESNLRKIQCFIEELFLRQKASFLSAFICGFLNSLGAIIYHVGNGDTTKWSIFQEDFAHERSLGRWLLEWVSFLRNDKVIPIFITILSILFLSVAAIFILDAVELKNKYFKCIFAAVFVSSPFVMYYIYIFYTSDAYCLGILMAAVCAWLIIKKDNIICRFLSAILIMCSLAIYQANMNIFIVLILLSYVVLLTGNVDIRNFLLKVVKDGLTLLLGLFFYLISVKISFKIFGGGLANYKGLDSIGSYNLSNILGILKTYLQHIKLLYFESNNYVSGSDYFSKVFNSKLINGILCILIFVFVAYFLWNKNKQKKNYVLLLLSFFIILLFWCPVDFASLAFAEEDAYKSVVNSLISPQYSFLYLFCFCLADKCDFKHVYLIKVCCALLTSCMLFNLVLATDEGYYGNELSWMQGNELASRILDRMEQTEGWSEGMPIAIYGGLNGDISSNYPTVNNDIRHSNMPLMWDGQTQISWIKYLKEYFGVEYTECDANWYMNYKNSNSYNEMDNFPAKNSVKVVDGIMVVKINDD